MLVCMPLSNWSYLPQLIHRVCFTCVIILYLCVFAKEAEQVIYQLEGLWFDPCLLQSACQISLGKLLIPSCSPMDPLEREC